MRQTHDRDPKKNKSAQTSCAKNTERLVKREVAPRCPEGPGAHSGNAGLAKGGAPRGGRGPAGGRTSLRFVLLRLALVVEAHGAPVHAVGLHAVLAAEAAGVVCGDRAAAVRGRGEAGGVRLPRGRAHTLQLAGAARGHTRVTLGPGRRESRPFPSLEGAAGELRSRLGRPPSGQ